MFAFNTILQSVVVWSWRIHSWNPYQKPSCASSYINLHWWFLVNPNYRFSAYFHMETRDPYLDSNAQNIYHCVSRGLLVWVFQTTYSKLRYFFSVFVHYLQNCRGLTKIPFVRKLFKYKLSAFNSYNTHAGLCVTFIWIGRYERMMKKRRALLYLAKEIVLIWGMIPYYRYTVIIP